MLGGQIVDYLMCELYPRYQCIFHHLSRAYSVVHIHLCYLFNRDLKQNQLTTNTMLIDDDHHHHHVDDDHHNIHQRESVSKLQWQQLCKGFIHLNVN